MCHLIIASLTCGLAAMSKSEKNPIYLNKIKCHLWLVEASLLHNSICIFAFMNTLRESVAIVHFFSKNQVEGERVTTSPVTLYRTVRASVRPYRHSTPRDPSACPKMLNWSALPRYCILLNHLAPKITVSWTKSLCIILWWTTNMVFQCDPVWVTFLIKVLLLSGLYNCIGIGDNSIKNNENHRCLMIIVDCIKQQLYFDNHCFDNYCSFQAVFNVFMSCVYALCFSLQ